MFCKFREKFENSKWPPFFARQIFLENWHGYFAEIPGLWVKHFVEIALSSTVFRDISIFMFCNFAKNSKIQNGRHFLRDKIFFENWHGYFAEIPCSSKNSSKSLYLARFSRYKHFYVLQFLRKIRKFKMAAIFGETIFFENRHGYSSQIPSGSKISSKSLYLVRFLRYRHFYVL